MCICKSRNRAFTLFELVIVLAIISAMVVIAVPFSKRSNEGLKIRQDGSSVAQALRYALDRAKASGRAVKFTFDQKDKSYSLQIADSAGVFRQMEDIGGSVRLVDKNINLLDIDGFEQLDQAYYLVFDPCKPWPKAWMSLATNDLSETIKINSGSVDVEETSI